MGEDDPIICPTRPDVCGSIERILGASPHFVIVVSLPHYHVLFVGGSARDDAGLAALDSQQAIGTRLWDLAPHLRDLLLPLFEEARASGTSREAREVQIGGGPRYWSIQVVPDATADVVAAVFTDTTERRELEETAWRYRYHLREAQRLAQLGSYEFTVPDRKATWSEETFRIMGVDPQAGEPTPEGFLQLIHPDDRHKVDSAVSKSLAENSRTDVEYRIILPDGSVKYIHGVGQPRTDEAGNVVGFFGTILDITPHKQAEAAIRESRQMLRLVLDAIPVRVFWKDRNSIMLGCNRGFAQDAGYASPEDVIGKSDFDLPWTHGQATAFREDDRRVMETGVPKLNYEETLQTAEGRTTWLRTSKIPLRDAEGNVIGVLGTFEDISDEKEAAEALRRSEERFRSLVETTSDWIWEVDAAGLYTYASPRVKDLLGYDPSEVIGRSPLDLMPPDEQERLAPVVRETFDFGKPIVALRNWNLHKNGTPVLLETSGTPVLDDHGHLVGYRGIDRDVTQRQRDEEALRQSEYRYAAAQRAAGIGSWDWDIPTGALHWSEQIEPMFGFAPGQFQRNYQAFLDRIHPDDRRLVADAVQAALNGTQEYAIEHRIIWPDGSVRWVSEKGEVHRDESGAPVRMFGIVQDVTARKLAEEERERLLTQVDAAKQAAQRDFATLQQALLPVKPHIGQGYDVAAAFIPAAPGQQIGGDFYDVFESETHKTVVLLGDVTGKDVSAAALAATTRSTIRAFAYELADTGQALTHTNAVVCAQRQNYESFVTAFLATLDLTTGGVRYATAGHPPPAVCRSDGRVEFLHRGTLPIAVAETVKYQENRVILQPGDKLVIYTDGISEARRGMELLELEGISGSLAKCLHCGAQEMLDHLIAEARDWAEGNLTDDIAVVVIERNAAPTAQL